MVIGAAAFRVTALFRVYYILAKYVATVQSQDKDYVSGNQEHEQYALINSVRMAALFGDDESVAETDLDRYVKIVSCENKKRKIYRKCSARYGINKDEVALGVRTQKELGCEADSKVKVSRTCWFNYYWRNSNKYLKFTFILAILGAICGIVSFVGGFVCHC